MINLKSNSKGYTLIQLVVVIAILGILTAISVPVYQNATGKAKDASAVATLDAMKTAFEMYATKNGLYPKNISTITDLMIALGIDFPYNVKIDGSSGSLVAVATEPSGSAYSIFTIGRDEDHYFGVTQNNLMAGPNTFFNCKVILDNTKPVLGRLVASLKDPDSSTRLAAVKKLGGLMDPRTARFLNDALEDKDPNVRASAKDALEKLKEKETVEEE